MIKNTNFYITDIVKYIKQLSLSCLNFLLAFKYTNKN